CPMIRKVERADGARYQVYAQKDGRKVYVGSYASKREAQSADEDHRVTQRKIAAGELPPELDTKRTLKDATDAWFAALKASGSRSLEPYGEFLKYQILPTLGTVPIAALTKKHIVRWRDDLATKGNRKGGGYAPTSINSALGCLSSAFSYFVSQEWLTVNPCFGVEQAQVPLRSFNWIKTRPELERLLLTCADDLRDMIAVSVGTAVRIDELLHLQWDDVDLDNRLLTIQRGRKGPPKNGRIRHVPIVNSMMPVFQRRALQRAGHALVFPGTDGKVRAPPNVTSAYKAALRRAGLDTRLRWHDLRHTAASWWVLGGGDIFRLSRLMGHANVKITQQTYAHLAPEAWQQDYGRLAFHVPSETAKIYEFHRKNGKMCGKTSIPIDARETSGRQALGGLVSI
ncbi:MAG: site-specific integrase, partial [Proteobacteria bacterium]|nr:site-specific integrase [Pseudomonadota bacterium]